MLVLPRSWVMLGRCLAAILGAAPRAWAEPAPPTAIVGSGLQQFLAEAAREGFTGAVLVARGDEVLLAEGYGVVAPGSTRPVTAETVFTTGSITKQFTATAILILHERGKLDLQDSLATFFADVPADKRSITLHQLLTHTAGFPGAIGDDRERIGRDAFVQRALTTPLLFEPGARYEYSNVGYSILAAVLEKVSGEEYEIFLRRNLFAPASMDDTGYRLPAWTPDRLAHGTADDGSDWGTLVQHLIGADGPGWNLVGNGGIHSTVRDMFRWHQALRGDAILAPRSKALLFAKHAAEPGGSWYGYGWSIEETPQGRLITHNGGNPYFFADFLRYDAGDVVIYYCTSSRDRRMRQLARPLARIVFTGEVPELPPAPPPARAEMQGPAAPEGSLAAKWGLPGSYRGNRAAELLEAITTVDAAWRHAFVERSFSPDRLQSRSASDLATSLASLRGEIGASRVARAWPEGAGVVVELAGEMPLRLEIGLEAEPPHRIVSIGLARGD